MPEGRIVTIMEAVEPHRASYDPRMMARGEPGLPLRFDWRGATYDVAEVLESWREVETCAEGDDRYVRRHGVRIRTRCGAVMCLTGSRGTGARAPRWTIRHLEPID